MKKITFLCFLFGTYSWVNSQVLNQNASWPNPAWTVTGSYETGATAFESDPTTTTNFAFDDDDALNGHEDNIAAESPVINLTSAFTAGETWLTVTAQYGYRYFANDQLRLEYWNADTSAWVVWGANIPGNSTTATDNFCTTITKTTFTSTTLSISSFTSTQLSGFKYRISYDDDPAAADWNYGFCFDSPTIVSTTPPSCPNPTALTATFTHNSAVLLWTENGSATLYNVEYGLNGFTQGTGTLLSGVSNSYNLSPLTALTAYSYYVQASCGGASGNSAWVGPFNFTTLAVPPLNDDCAGAIALTVNPDFACGAVTPGTTQGGTLSMAATPCFGNPDDDVWFSFVATATSHRVALSNIVAIGGTGTSVDAYMQVLSGTCGSQTSVICSDPNTATATSLTIGETYYVRVYTYGITNNITFNICVGTPPPPPANDECTGAIALTVNPDYLCGSVTAGSVASATASATDATACAGTEDDDVWFSFVATATSHKISLLNVAGSATDMFHSLWTGDCASLTLVPSSCSDPNASNPTGLTIGQTYYVRVNTYTATVGQDTAFNICIGTPPPPPSNDECSGAISLTVNPDFLCGTVTPGTVAGATASSTDATACAGTEDDDVWFSFVATSTAHRISILNAIGSVTDMYHSLWIGADCGSLTLVAGSCSDADVSNRTGLTIGQTYYVRVNTYSATGGQTTTFNVCVGTPPPPPTNDNFANSIAITCGTIYTGDTSVSVTIDEDNAPDGFGADLDAPNLWYSFTGSGSPQTVTLDLCGSSYDTSVLVYTGTSGNLTLVAGNDDDASCVSNGANSKLNFTSDGTTTYYITVEGFNVGSVGAFTMNVTCAAVNPPAVPNQDCGTALTVLVDGLDNNSDNSFGTVSSTQPTCDTFGSIQDVWFSFVAPASGLVTALLTPTTMTSMNFNIYSGDCGALTAVANTCNSNLTVATSEVLTGLTPGSTYFVQVWSNASEQGTFALRLSDDGLGNSDFDSANFSYYPNPVKNTLNLSYNQEISNVEIFNLLGQKVGTNVINANQGQVNMSSLNDGVYLVKVTSNNQVKTIRVIKE